MQNRKNREVRRCPTTAPAQDPARSVVSLSISFKKQIYKNRYYYLLLIPAIVYLAAISGIDTYVYRVGVFSAEFSFRRRRRVVQERDRARAAPGGERLCPAFQRACAVVDSAVAAAGDGGALAAGVRGEKTEGLTGFDL